MKNSKKPILILLVVIVIIVTAYRQYIALLQDIESTAKSKEAQINRHIDLSKGFVDLMTIYGNNFFQHGKTDDSELYKLLSYDTASNTYNLDAVEGTKYQKMVGNLTGMGNIPESGVLRDEVNLAFKFNQHFSSIYNKLPDIAWLYYTSENDFINIFPWVSSQEFIFKEDLQAEKFYTYVTPQNNPLRESLWTPAYLDHAGKGLMVTLSSPIYDKDTFMGVVSIDLTNSQLSEMIKSKYAIYIIDDTNSVIANSLDIQFDQEVPTLETLLGISKSSAEELKTIRNNTIQRVGEYYIYAVDFNNAPWRMIFRVPVWLVVGKATLFALPILTICLLLLFTFFEVEKRKKTEVQLTDSLEELTSYQKLLENAAKYDFLTSTINRRGLMDVFYKNIYLNKKTETSLSFILGDIDYFKKFNDAYGHAAGDKILIEIANIMQKNVSQNDVVCRWGGEEFIIMLLDKTYEEAMAVAEKIRKEIESTVIPWENETELRATMTFGVAQHVYEDSFETSITKADRALYMGKERGRNQVVGSQDC